MQAALLDDLRACKVVAVVQMLGGRDGYIGRVNLQRHAALTEFGRWGWTSKGYAAVVATALAWAVRLGLIEAADEPSAQGLGALAGLRDGRALYDTVKALTDRELDELHAFLTVLTFGQGDLDQVDHGNSLFNAVADDLDVDMRAWWRPDPDFLEGRTREQLERIAVESGAAPSLGRLARYGKGELVKALATYFERTAQPGDEPTPDDVKGRDWLPDAMRFGAEPEALTAGDSTDEAPSEPDPSAVAAA